MKSAASVWQLAVAVAIVYLVMAVLFESFVYLISRGALEWGPAKQVRRRLMEAVSPARTTTYTLIALNQGGSVSTQTTLLVEIAHHRGITSRRVEDDPRHPRVCSQLHLDPDENRHRVGVRVLDDLTLEVELEIEGARDDRPGGREQKERRRLVGARQVDPDPTAPLVGRDGRRTQRPGGPPSHGPGHGRCRRRAGGGPWVNR